MSPPDHRDSTPMITVNGRNDAPAAAAEYPWTWMRLNGTKNMEPESAKYNNSVIPFAPVKFRERNSCGGIIGARARHSNHTNTAMTATATTSGTSTFGCVHPLSDAIVNP